ncbi:hypothetical protein HJD18_02475 [Thermoleophilia bacterium SCSIO 60948]|nr:hypothetical protein HJD18_02475 [Thermoleophilia bacterium SCSIO 60948]
MSPWSEQSAIGVTPFRHDEHSHEGFHESAEYTRWAEQAETLAGELGVAIAIEDAAGNWMESAEPSALIRLGTLDPEVVDNFAEAIARAGEQMAVVRFVPDADGPDVAYRFPLAAVERDRLEQAAKLVTDLPGASLEIGELTLHVLGRCDVLADPIAEIARLLDCEPESHRGHFAEIETGVMQARSNGHSLGRGRVPAQRTGPGGLPAPPATT